MEVKPARSIFEAARSSRARRDTRQAPRRADPLPDGLQHLDPVHAAAVRRAAEMVKAADRAVFYQQVEAALKNLHVGDGALYRIIKAVRCGQRMPDFDARSSLDRIRDEDVKAAASSPLIASAAPDR